MIHIQQQLLLFLNSFYKIYQQQKNAKRHKILPKYNVL